MKKFNKSTGFVIAVFALTSMLWADADFSVSFTASGGGSDYTMTVGMSPYATDGYDVGIDQYAPPAPPPPSFDAAIGWGGDRYYTQIVASTESEVEFDIQLQYPEGNTIVLTWDNSAWASYGTFVLQDAFGGAMINVDMNATTTHTLTNPAFNTLKLFVTAIIPVTNPFEGLTIPTPYAGVFWGQVTVSGENATSDDWIAVFDEDGNCAGATPLTMNDGIAYINLPIYGDDPSTEDVDEGMNSSETFLMKVWDMSDNLVIIYPVTFDGWYNNNGAPMDGYNNIDQVYNFELPVGNVAPVARAGADRTVEGGVVVTLNGLGSYDLNNDELSYLWTSPNGIELSDVTASQPTFTAPAVDEDTPYTFSLVVNDGALDSDPDEVVVTVTQYENNPPIPPWDDEYGNWGESFETNEDTPLMIELTVEDPDGDDVEIIIISDPVHGSLDGLVYTPNENFYGADSFNVVAYDGELYSEEATVWITVLPVNDAPVVDAGEDFAVGQNVEVVLMGAADDVDSDIASVLWESADASIILSNANTMAATFTSPTVTEITDYSFTLTATDIEGESGIDEIVITVDPALAIDDVLLPEEFALRQNYPNPFNPVTTIGYDIAESGNVRISVYALTGQRIKTLVSGYKEPGRYEATWNSTDSNGNLMPTGVYFYAIETSTYTATKKLVLIK